MTPLYRNILDQPHSLEHVADLQFGTGRPRLLEAAALLRPARHIVLSGMGSSFFASMPLGCYLSSRGIPATLIETSELLHFHRKMLTRDSVLVLVSRSGETIEATRLLDALREEGVPVIGVTNEEGSTLARQAAHSILVGSARDQLAAVQTYSGTLAALLFLGAAVSGEMDANLRAGLASACQALAQCLDDCVRRIGEWREFLESARPLYLFGRGASLASVFQATLMIHEVAKTPAVAMSAAQFRHGPVEVVDPSFRGIVLGSQAATSGLDAALARDLVRMGAKVGWIGPAAPDLPALCDWPSQTPGIFTPLIDIAPLQLAAYHLAVWRGIAPGQFRHATLVTASETGFRPV